MTTGAATLERAVEKISLRDARTQLGLTQGQLAEMVPPENKIHYNLISACENGRPIWRYNAYLLLDAINKKREQRGWKPLTIWDIDWTLRG